MSNNALFSNSSRSLNKNLVEIKAGKMTMKGNTIHPDNRKGQIYVYQSDDSLMHFCWKDRTTGVVEDDLIIFPDDCEFKHVSQCKTGRVYLLKFKSSSRKFFFWLQDYKIDKDDEQCKKINELLNNPPTPTSQRNIGSNSEGDLQNLLNNMSQQQLMQLFGGVGQIGGFSSLLGSMNRSYNNGRIPAAAPIGTGASVISANSEPTSPPPPSSSVGNLRLSSGSKPAELSNIPEVAAHIDSNLIKLSDLQNFLSEIPNSSKDETTFQRKLAEELTNLVPAALTSDVSLNDNIMQLLPKGDDLSTTLSSPQFSQALLMFWCSIQSGHVAPIVRQFGLSNQTANAAAAGDLEKFIESLSTVEYCIQDSSKKESPSNQATLIKDEKDSELKSNNSDKKDDNDEGMALD